MRRLIAVGVAMLTMFAAGGVFASDGGDDSSSDEVEKQYDTVEEDQTLAALALEHGVAVAELKEWNDLEDERVEPGTRLVVKSKEKVKQQREDDGPEPVIHRIERGDTLREIGDKYGVSTAKVKRWNQHLDPRNLQLGDHVRLYVPTPGGDSVSWGAASAGRLFNGVPLKSTDGLDVRSIAQAYGTDRVVRLLETIAADIQRRWPNTPDLYVGDLSYRKGGPMGAHKSHQSGRDADIAYYYKGNVEVDGFFEMTKQTFDARKNWHFFKMLIDAGVVEFIFVNYYLQKPLYKYARSIGYSKETLKGFLQYPRSKYKPVGVIRHAPGHDDHFHIRFTCDEDDKQCR